MKKPLIVIAGPTACGKTKTSIILAKKVGGEIISADSMQVYKYMDIGTAKISREEMQGVPHYLIDEIFPDEEYNVRIFKEKAKGYMEKIYSRGHIPIVVGGTGFYINALVNDNFFMETNCDETLKNSLKKQMETDGELFMHKKLEELDPVSAAAIHPNNKKRVIRALEYYYLTGNRISSHNTVEKQRSSPYNTAFFILNMSRDLLYQRIEERIDKMISDGLLDEVRALIEGGYSDELVSMQGLGYKEIIPVISGSTELKDAVEILKKSTRHFAKRQLTWFRHQTDGNWIDVTSSSADETVTLIVEYLKEHNFILGQGENV